MAQQRQQLRCVLSIVEQQLFCHCLDVLAALGFFLFLELIGGFTAREDGADFAQLHHLRLGDDASLLSILLLLMLLIGPGAFAPTELLWHTPTSIP